MGGTLGLEPLTSTQRRAVPWLLALAIALPAFIPLVGHYVGFSRMGQQPTGFLIYDTAYYLANAREHFDNGQFSAFYSNAFSYDYASPRIYFQPLTLALGVILHVTHCDPGLLLACVGVVTAILGARAAIALFDRYGDRSAEGGTLSLIAFCWGGGLFVVVGTILSFVVHPPGHAFDLPGWWWFVRVADPAGGWWFLNLGRNLVLPTEALYHALFFACIAATVARQFALSLALAAALSLSHPFTGLELLAVLGAWSALEFLLIRDRVVPWWFVAGVAGLTVVHAGYYLWFLPRFPEHRQLQEQWTLAWTLSFPQSLLAYGIVAPLALVSLGTPSRIRRTLGAWPNRLLLIWLLVTLALENHDLFLPRPIQPLHFTRGYSWVAFFLLGLPTLTRFFQRVRRGARQPLGWAVVGTALTVLLADNATWLGATTTMGLELDLGRNLPADSVRQGFGLTPDQQDVLRYLNSDDCARRVVVSEDMTLGYLVTVYTPLRSWRSHYANTPWSAVRTRELAAFFGQGTVVEAWHSLPLVFVFRSSSPWQERVKALGASPVAPDHRNNSYVVLRLGPAGVGQSMPSDAPSRVTAAPK